MPALKSSLLDGAGFRHAFFTRRSDGAERAAALLGVASERLYYLSQVHGADCRVIEGHEDREAVRAERGDVTLSRASGVACAVRVADCAPVLVGDRRSGAVAAIHSGWRGTVADVVGAGVAALRRLLGDDGDLVAAVGPHIERCCFEVGEDVARQIASLGASEAIVRGAARPHADLRRVIEAQLRAAGVRAVDQVAGCTMCDRERFHSFRRDGKESGRMLAVIVTTSQ